MSQLQTLIDNKAALIRQLADLRTQQKDVIGAISNVEELTQASVDAIHNAVVSLTPTPIGNLFKIGDKFYVVGRTADISKSHMIRYTLEQINPIVVE